MHNRLLGAIYLATLGVGIAAAVWLVDGAGRERLAAASPIIGALLVSIGWMVTTLVTNRNNQRSHTITMVSNSKHENATRWDIVNKYLPSQTNLPLPKQLPENFPENHELYATVDSLLNDFDFIALGALKGVYDRQMLWSALANDFLDLLEMTRAYIVSTQEAKEDDEIWMEFAALCVSWGAPPLSAKRSSGRGATELLLCGASLAALLFPSWRWKR